MNKGAHRRVKRGRITGRRLGMETAGLVLSLFLIVNQSIGLIAARASSGASRVSRDRIPGFVDTTTVTHGGEGDVSAAKPPTHDSATTPRTSPTGPGAPVAPFVAITSSQIDAFQGQIAGTSNWTAGNLCQGNGVCYHELDYVPHRIIFKNLTGGTTYTIGVSIDVFDGAGHPGYYEINTPTGSGLT